ncbi:hypothetical protein HRbin30_02459 [bacterium HR30]|nr:hypothetical protein HRbin30_02459 [bacterium HR30]
MKLLHRDDLFGWSQFNEERNLDFHSVLWVRTGGNVVVDPLPLTAHDRAHLERLGGVAWIVVTNSDHTRAAAELAAATGARVAGPQAERETFPIHCDRWLHDGEEVVAGLKVYELHGSKTPGELALFLQPETLITGDLVRCHRAGWLCLLPREKLKDPHAARASVKRLVDIPGIDAVLVGDGWPVFRDGHQRLVELWESLSF